MMLHGTIQHFEMTLAMLEDRDLLTHQASLVDGIVHQYDHAGRWPSELRERLALMSGMGLPPLHQGTLTAYATALTQHHFRDELVVNLHYALAVAAAQESRGGGVRWCGVH